MAEQAGRVLEGVFAVNKPPSITSAQVIRDLQHAFKNSRTFTPLLEDTLAREKKNKQRSKRRRIDSHNVFKMGHGGTLDPMATGVLIIGIGRGTKSLQNFLDCTKTYETVVLFGKSTDTYDVAGKIVATSDTSNITRELVEEKLSAFRGNIKQVPPIYSALRIDGMKAYDYARSGKELPRELAARSMKVTECVMTDWFESGKHAYRWPAEEAPKEEKDVFTKLVDIATPDKKKRNSATSHVADGNSEVFDDTVPAVPEVGQKSQTDIPDSNELSREAKAALHTHEISGLSAEPANAPAARIRLTVSSGFYVRSFAHDLGIACGSYGTMVELARTRQAEFSAADPPPEGLFPAIEHADLQHGEESWSPRLTQVLEQWLAQNPSDLETNHSANFPAEQKHHRGYKKGRLEESRKRRNSSSPE